MFGRNGKTPELKILDEIHFELDLAGIYLRKVMKHPLCVPNCGKCCEINSITIKGVEARYIAYWLKKQKPEVQKNVVDRCRKWLFEDFEKVGTKWGLGTVGMPPNVIDQVNQEISWLSQKSGCPMMNENKQCVIYPARPLVCQAYGVTRVVPATICPRPPSNFEPEDHRMYVKNKNTDRAKELIEKLKSTLEDSSYISTQGFIAAMVFLEMEPQKFVEHAYHNEIASAKLIQMAGGHYLWQEQLQENIDREDEIRILVNPMAIEVDPNKIEV